MKKFMNLKVIGYGLWVMVALLVSAPLTAQKNQEQWKTSTMQGSGSAYSPQVTAVGATYVENTATTTESYSPARGPRKTQSSDNPWGQNQDGGDTSEEGSPLGDGLIPLSLLALAYGAVVYFRRRKQTLNG